MDFLIIVLLIIGYIVSVFVARTLVHKSYKLGGIEHYLDSFDVVLCILPVINLSVIIASTLIIIDESNTQKPNTKTLSQRFFNIK